MTESSDDPLLRHARREAIFVACVFLAALVYTVGYCAKFGYAPTRSGELKLVFGFPDWVFWGIVTPWVICVAIGIWFSYFFMTDDDVGSESATSGTTEDSTSG